MNEAKYQWSINKPGTGEIMVVRGDEYQQWVMDIEEVRNGLLRASTTIEDAVGEQNLERPVKKCPLHNTGMEQKWSEKKQKHYWSHVWNGELCFGHP